MPIKSVLSGYPVYVGSKKISVVDFKGPLSYATGGESVEAAQFCQGGIDFAEVLNKRWLEVTQGAVATYQMVAASLSGTYFATIEFGAGATDSASSMTLKWYVTATGAEVADLTDLSAETVRILMGFV
jgi:hypothetical protein